MRKTIKRTGFIAVSAVALTTVGVAFAAWTSTGSGDGDAASEAISALTFSEGDAADALYPTGASDISFTVANPNRYNAALSDLTIVSVTAVDSDSVAVDTNGADAGGTDLEAYCDLTLATQVDAIVVAAEATAAPVALADALVMGNDAPNLCSNLDFAVQLTSTATSTAATATTDDQP